MKAWSGAPCLVATLLAGSQASAQAPSGAPPAATAPAPEPAIDPPAPVDAPAAPRAPLQPRDQSKPPSPTQVPAGSAATDAGADAGDTSATDASAEAGDAGADGPTPAGPDAPAVAKVDPTTCEEKLPEGKARPELTESFPDRGVSGHASTLEIVIHHGRGEKVLPNGLALSLDGEGSKAVTEAGFALPDPNGAAPPTLETRESGERSITVLKLPVVPLPKEAGRHSLTLPPLPITVARASGELMTLCTKPHVIVVEDPIANTPNPEPRQNPPPRRQRELWVAAKQATLIGLIALAIGALLAWLYTWWRKRPKPAPPPPPPRPPWEVALEELFDIKNAGLIEQERYAEHFARVSHTIRQYLGDRYGYDGLESTTREALSVLRSVAPRLSVMDRIEAFLRQADLVKFARLTPSAEECELALARGEDIVEKTMPVQLPGAPGSVTMQAPGPRPPNQVGNDRTTESEQPEDGGRA